MSINKGKSSEFLQEDTANSTTGRRVVCFELGTSVSPEKNRSIATCDSKVVTIIIELKIALLPNFNYLEKKLLRLKIGGNKRNSLWCTY